MIIVRIIDHFPDGTKAPGVPKVGVISCGLNPLAKQDFTDKSGIQRRNCYGVSSVMTLSSSLGDSSRIYAEPLHVCNQCGALETQTGRSPIGAPDAALCFPESLHDLLFINRLDNCAGLFASGFLRASRSSLRTIRR